METITIIASPFDNKDDENIFDIVETDFGYETYENNFNEVEND